MKEKISKNRIKQIIFEEIVKQSAEAILSSNSDMNVHTLKESRMIQYNGTQWSQGMRYNSSIASRTSVNWPTPSFGLINPSTYSLKNGAVSIGNPRALIVIPPLTDDEALRAEFRAMGLEGTGAPDGIVVYNLETELFLPNTRAIPWTRHISLGNLTLPNYRMLENTRYQEEEDVRDRRESDLVNPGKTITYDSLMWHKSSSPKLKVSSDINANVSVWRFVGDAREGDTRGRNQGITNWSDEWGYWLPDPGEYIIDTPRFTEDFRILEIYPDYFSEDKPVRWCPVRGPNDQGIQYAAPTSHAGTDSSISSIGTTDFWNSAACVNEPHTGQQGPGTFIKTQPRHAEETPGQGVIQKNIRVPTYAELEQAASGIDYEYEPGNDPFEPFIESKKLRENASRQVSEETMEWIRATNFEFPDGLTTTSQKRHFCLNGHSGRITSGGTTTERNWPAARLNQELWDGFSCPVHYKQTINGEVVETSWDILQDQRLEATPSGDYVGPEGEEAEDASRRTRRRGSGIRTGARANRIRELQVQLGVDPVSGRWTDATQEKWESEVRRNLHDLTIGDGGLSEAIVTSIATDWGGAGHVNAGDYFNQGASYDRGVLGMIQFLRLMRDQRRLRAIYVRRDADIARTDEPDSEYRRAFRGPYNVGSLIHAPPYIMTVREISNMGDSAARDVARLLAVHATGESENPITIERTGGLRRVKISVPSGVTIRSMGTLKRGIAGVTESGMKIALRIRRIPEQS